MLRALYLFLVAVNLAVATAMDDQQSASLTALETRLQSIEDELPRLAQFSLRNGVGSIGYRSADQPEGADKIEWVEVRLDHPSPIDQIILAPVIWHDARTGHRADAFPAAFRILAGTHDDTEGSIVASFTESDAHLPRLAPLIVPCDIVATWVRVEASRLSPRGFDGKYCLQLSELMLFNGPDNVALHQSVETSPRQTRNFPGSAYNKTYLVDGHLPYVMNAGRGEPSTAFLSQAKPDSPASITIDLGRDYPIDQIQLHTIESSDTTPQSHPSDFGIPRHLLIEGASKADFSDARALANLKYTNAFQTGPILGKTFSTTNCRYVKLTVLASYRYRSIQNPNMEYIAGFAEFEIFSAGINVARHKAVYKDFPQSRYIRSETSLTDGRNIYGEILPIRQWLQELARRHELETERPLLDAELDRRYARQKNNLRRMIWLATLLTAGIGFTILIDRMLRIRSISRMKNRFAADLHDELGANIHAIGMLNELAKDADSEDERNMLSRRIAKLTERTGSAIRHCTNMLEAKNLYLDLVKDMQQASKRIATNIEYNFSASGEAELKQLKPRIQADLLLFYKESLVNICRHSGATKMNACLTATPCEIHLTIDDNGIGIAAPPPSLQRRARLIGANVAVGPSTQGGTRISLTIHRRRLPFQRKRR